MYVLHPHKYIIVVDLGNKQEYGTCEKTKSGKNVVVKLTQIGEMFV